MSETLDLDSGDFEPVNTAAGGVETESQSRKGSGNRVREEGGSYSIKTSPSVLKNKEAVDWEAIKQAAIAGVMYPQLERQFGISQGRIRTMACRKQWPTPDRAKAQAEAKLREAQAELHRAKLRRAGRSEEAEGVTAVTIPLIEASRREIVAATITDSMDEMAQTGLMASMKRAFRSVMQSADFFPIESLQELNTATKLLKTCAGLDGPQVAVNLGLFTSNQPDAASLGVVIDDCAETGD